ncbi:MAG: hypothetical protein ACXIU8_06135 [Alkalilacustris sp.]
MRPFAHAPLAAPVLAATLAGGLWTAAAAQVQQFRHDGAEVTLHLHDFLSAEDRALLEVVASTPEGLAVLLGDGGGHAAIALAPADGMMRDGRPSASASAVGQLPDAAAARTRALDTCNAARSGGAACVVVLEVAPR